MSLPCALRCSSVVGSAVANATAAHAVRPPRGFTLIELMITVAIVGILAAVAYPSYLEQVAKGRRTEAKAILLQANQWMERFYAENYRYDQNTAAPPVAVTDAELFAGRFSQSPPPPAGASYTISLTNLAAQTYRVKATRTGSMAADPCGDFVITHTGAKGILNYGARFASEGAAVAECWR